MDEHLAINGSPGSRAQRGSEAWMPPLCVPLRGSYVGLGFGGVAGLNRDCRKFV